MVGSLADPNKALPKRTFSDRPKRERDRQRQRPIKFWDVPTFGTPVRLGRLPPEQPFRPFNSLVQLLDGFRIIAALERQGFAVRQLPVRPNGIDQIAESILSIP